MPYLILVGAGIVAAVGYAISCAIWPFTRCGGCSGTGKRSRSDGKVWRTCRRCKGSGRRVRIGHRLWSWSQRVKDGAE